MTVNDLEILLAKQNLFRLLVDKPIGLMTKTEEKLEKILSQDPGIENKITFIEEKHNVK